MNWNVDRSARYWPNADAQAGGVSDMSRKVGTEWAVPPITQLLEFLSVTGWNNRVPPTSPAGGKATEQCLLLILPDQ
jgi:hypothetical protein